MPPFFQAVRYTKNSSDDVEKQNIFLINTEGYKS